MVAFVRLHFSFALPSDLISVGYVRSRAFPLEIYRPARYPAPRTTGPQKDASGHLPALQRLVTLRAHTLPAESLSGVSQNTLRSPTSLPSRPSHLTGWSATSRGRPGGPTTRTHVAGWLRFSMKSVPLRTSPEPCRSRSRRPASTK